MKAIVYDRSNTTEHLVYQEIDKPVPADNEVLVKIMFTAINAADYRSMSLGIIPARKIFGADIAGVVESVGKDVTRFRTGDEVFGDILGNGFGGFAEFVCAPERYFAKKPAGVPFVSTAAVSMAGMTALQGLRNLGNIQSGQTVLVCGAGGGVGNYCVQLAKYFGAEVTAVCGPHNVELMHSFGADFVIDYSKEDFTCGNKKYDLILAVNGKQSLTEYKRLLTPKGTLVVLGGALSQLFSVMLLGKLHSLGGKKLLHLQARPCPEDLEFLIKLVEEGKIKVIIDRTYPLSETAEAMRYASRGHSKGKVVIQIV